MSAQIGDYHITNIVANAKLGIKLNLSVLAKNLPINDEIRDIKLWGVSERKYPESEDDFCSQYDEVLSTSIKRFSNQCSINIKPKGVLIPLNMKIYGTGKIVMTGCRDINVMIRSMQILIGYLPKEGVITYDNSTNYSLWKVSSICKDFVETSKINPTRKITKDERAYFHRAKRTIILNKEEMEHVAKYFLDNKNTTIVSDIIEALLMCDVSKINTLIFSNENNQKWMKLYEILLIYYENISKLDLANNPIVKIFMKDNRHKFDSICLPLTYGKTINPLECSKNIKITNYHSVFSTNLILSLSKMCKLLNSEKNFVATYEPTGNPKINAKYRSTIECKMHLPSESINNSKTICKCCSISFFLSKERTVILTGVKTKKQLEDAYINMKNIFIKYADILKENNDIDSGIIKILTQKEIDKVPEERMPDFIYNKKIGQFYIRRDLIV